MSKETKKDKETKRTKNSRLTTLEKALRNIVFIGDCFRPLNHDGSWMYNHEGAELDDTNRLIAKDLVKGVTLINLKTNKTTFWTWDEFWERFGIVSKDSK